MYFSKWVLHGPSLVEINFLISFAVKCGEIRRKNGEKSKQHNDFLDETFEPEKEVVRNVEIPQKMTMPNLDASRINEFFDTTNPEALVPAQVMLAEVGPLSKTRLRLVE